MSSPTLPSVLVLSAVLSVAWPAHAEIVQLEVEGFRPAVAVVPPPSDMKRPLIVALHGNYDRPEWQCGVWTHIAGPDVFVLCPRGVPRTDAPRDAERWTWDGLAKTRKEVDAALAALDARYSGKIEERAAILVGFSLGATMAARIGSESPERFSRLVLVEGGESVWSLPVARRFVKAGGTRILAACGQAACFPRFRALTRAFESAQLPFRVVGTSKVGHTYDGEVATAVGANWPWFIGTEDATLASP